MMKIGEYKTNGKAVVHREVVDRFLHWQDTETSSTTIGLEQATALGVDGWRTMLPGEVALWCFPRSPADAVSARDWMGMWDVARRRADAAEEEVKRLKAIIATARTTLHPTIELSNGSYQEGYRYAAARVLAILGEP